MRSIRAALQPLALGAPSPPVQLPAQPSRSIHVFDPSNPRMVEKLPALAHQADVLLANLEDGIRPDQKAAARQSLVAIANNLDRGNAQLWVRVNGLDAPWFLDDMLTLTSEACDRIDVYMLPKVQGPEDIEFADRLLAQLEARAGAHRPILVHALLESALGISNVDAICGASLRLQGVSIGPADLAADRRMKTTRVGGGHPDYLVRADSDEAQPSRATYLQDLWHYTVSRVVDACAAHGVAPIIGPFGDIHDHVGCEDHFRRASVMGCAGGWTLHPSQLPIAERVFSPRPSEVAWAEKVIAALGDGTGTVLVEGTMQDDATVRQCVVVLETARLAVSRNPDLAAEYGW
ncbi:MAG: CoA ester lyase [Actinobacteria bacterium]|nr:CoA ester lyase [Actinomycetota bacterium]